METNIGEKQLEELAEDILIGIGHNTEANREYVTTWLEDITSYVTELCAVQIKEKYTLTEKVGSIDANRDTIEL